MARRPANPTPRRCPSGWLIGLLLLTLACPARAQWTNPKANPKPEATPQRRSGGESVPPLPLPATPIRRTERKRPPAAPVMVGMINLTLSGQTAREVAFPTTTIDIEALMKQANSTIYIITAQ